MEGFKLTEKDKNPEYQQVLIPCHNCLLILVLAIINHFHGMPTTQVCAQEQRQQ